jgi:protein-tyrosine phosphatase
MNAKESLTEKYGGKKALLKYIYYRLLYLCGTFKKFSVPEWHKVNRLVFICMGNINRSAYAEFKAKSIGIESISYGIDADEKKGASPNATQNAADRNIDLGTHQCRSMAHMKLRSGDLVLGVEPAHIKAIENAIGDKNIQLSLLGLWCDTPTPYIQDPICRSDTYFQYCFARIDQAVLNLKSKIATNTS